MNLYGFANGDPVNYSDPFGLCEKPAGVRRGVIGICIETFIKGGPLMRAIGGADNRGFSSTGGTYRTSDRFTVDMASGRVGPNQMGNGMGKTFGRFEGHGFATHGAGLATEGGVVFNADAIAFNGLYTPPWAINYNFTLSVSKEGEVSISGIHDGYPSYEVWVYEEGKPARRIYGHQESGNLADLRPPAEKKTR